MKVLHSICQQIWKIQQWPGTIKGQFYLQFKNIFIIFGLWDRISSVQFSCSVVPDSLRAHESQHARPPCPSVHHQLPEFTQTHAHRVADAIQPSHPLSSPSSPAHNPSQHQGLFQWVNSSHEVAKVLEFPLQWGRILMVYYKDIFIMFECESASRSVVSNSLVTPWPIQSMEFSRPEYWSW